MCEPYDRVLPPGPRVQHEVRLVAVLGRHLDDVDLAVAGASPNRATAGSPSRSRGRGRCGPGTPSGRRSGRTSRPCRRTSCRRGGDRQAAAGHADRASGGAGRCRSRRRCRRPHFVASSAAELNSSPPTGLKPRPAPIGGDGAERARRTDRRRGARRASARPCRAARSAGRRGAGRAARWRPGTAASGCRGPCASGTLPQPRAGLPWRRRRAGRGYATGRGTGSLLARWRDAQGERQRAENGTPSAAFAELRPHGQRPSRINAASPLDHIRDPPPGPVGRAGGADRAAVAVGPDPWRTNTRTRRLRGAGLQHLLPVRSTSAASSGGCVGLLRLGRRRAGRRRTPAGRRPGWRAAPTSSERAERGRELVERELRVLGGGTRALTAVRPVLTSTTTGRPAASTSSRSTRPRSRSPGSRHGGRDLVDEVELHRLLDRDQPQPFGPAGPHPAVERRRACRAPGPARGGRTRARPRRAAPRPSAGRRPAPPVAAPAASAWTSACTERAGDRRQRTHVAAAVALEHPAQRATHDLLDVRRGHGHDRVGARAAARRSRRGASAVPVVRMGAGDARPRPAGPAAPRPGGAGRRAPRASGSGLVGRARRARSSPTSSASTRARPGRCTGRSAWSGRRRRVELVEEAGGLLRPPLHRADQQGVPGTGAGDVEQPALLGEQRRDPRHRGTGGLGDPGEQVDEPLVAQQAAAQPQVGPRALLDAGHGDDVPLPAAGGVRGEQLDGVAARGAGRPANRRGAAARRGTR